MKKIVIVLVICFLCIKSFAQDQDAEYQKYKVVFRDNTEKVIEVIKIKDDMVYYWDNKKRATLLKSDLNSIEIYSTTSTSNSIKPIPPINKTKEFIKNEIGNSDLYVYCEILGIGKFLSKKVTISIDYGQEQSFFSDNRIKDETGKAQSFNSMIDALNYMGQQGWEFVQAFIVTEGANQNVYHYLLKRRK